MLKRCGKMKRCKGLYYKGEDIGMRLRGSEKVDLDATDWEVALCQGQEEAVVLPKALAVRNEDNTYTLWVDAARTAEMRSGKWDIRIRVKGEKTHIAVVVNVITLVEPIF